MQIAQTQCSLKEKQRHEREELILQVAEDVFLEKGYHETSMDEIAACVGVAKGTVYLHFPRKEDLIVAIFARDVQRFSRALDTAMASDMTVRVKLEGFLHFMYGGNLCRRAQLLYMLHNNADLRHLFAEKDSCLREMWESIADRVAALLEEGKAAGELNTSIPTEVMMSAFFSLLSPRSYERVIRGKQTSPEELASYLGQIYFQGVAAR